MAGETFRFRKFQVKHNSSSMRVGTDAVLLGAWAGDGAENVHLYRSVLDIGCGCGVIALMAAQRFPNAKVHGIDIDASSVMEATENARQSIFSDRVEFSNVDVRKLAVEPSHERYDLILCNPPYYTEDTLPPDKRRSMARNTLHLSFEDLIKSVCLLMSEDGVFALIIPMQARDFFVSEALVNALHIRRECRVKTVSRKTPKRVLLEFGFQNYGHVVYTDLILQDANGERSADYSLICKDFYL